MSNFYYKYENNQYTWVADGKELLTTHQVAICFDSSIDAIVLKHGEIDVVEKLAKAYAISFLAAEKLKDIVFDIKVVIFPINFDVEEINKCVLNTGYLNIFLKKYSKLVIIKPPYY